VRDHARGTEAARLFGLIGLVMFVAPGLAPAIGSLMLALANWHAIFVLLAVYAAGLGLLLQASLFKRLPMAQRLRTPLRTLVTNYWTVLRHPAAMRFIGLQGLAFSVMLVFITHASFLYQEWFGLSKTAFSVLFAANVVGMAAVNLLNRHLLLSVHSARILRVAVVVQALAVAALTLFLWAGLPVAFAAGAIIAAVASMGAIAPNNMANALEFFPRLGGTAAALMGATQFTLAGAVSALSTRVGATTPLPIALTMAACAAVALSLALGAPAAVEHGLAREGNAQA
jgi:DHA1 family bicyclomycin/chloramphenicol resistance-like MFS transporter